MVKSYRRKPVVVKAIQFKGPLDPVSFMALGELFDTKKDGWLTIENFPPNRIPELVLTTSEGEIRANVGDWIIKDIDDGFIVCTDEAFKENYELVCKTKNTKGQLYQPTRKTGMRNPPGPE